jgi:ADP-ribose pyrophosphatase
MSTATTPFTGRAFSVRVEDVEYAPGRRHSIETVVHSNAVTIVPVDADGRVVLVRQYRHSAREVLLELPAGGLNEGEDPATAAGRELQEEIGMRAGRIEPLGGFWLAPGYSTEYMHVFLARDLKPDPLEQDEDEQIEVVPVPAADVQALIARGELRDAKSLAALLLWTQPR